jgi:flagellar hook-length control protein FliK
VPPVRLAELAEAARAAIYVTARQGHPVARIVLHPKELGTIEIRLKYGADGISASVRADSPQAAQALAQASGDLRQALAAQGLDLLDLDIHDGGRDTGPRTPFTSSPHRGGSGAEADQHEVTVDATRLPAAGSVVDVLA